MLSLLLIPLLPVITQMTGEFMQWAIFPDPLLPASIALVNSEHSPGTECICQRQGRGFEVFFSMHWDPPDSECTAHCASQLCSLFPLSWHSTALFSRTHWTYGETLKCGRRNLCPTARIRKIRTEGQNLHTQLIILYMRATMLKLKKIIGSKEYLHKTTGQPTLSNPKIQSSVIEVNKKRNQLF